MYDIIMIITHHSRKKIGKSGNISLTGGSFFRHFERIAVETVEIFRFGTAVSHMAETVMTNWGRNSASFAFFASKVW